MIWDQFWADSGSIWDRFGIDLWSMWGRFWVDLGSIWGRFGIGFGVDLGSVCQTSGKSMQSRRNFVRKGIVRKGGPAYMLHGMVCPDKKHLVWDHFWANVG